MCLKKRERENTKLGGCSMKNKDPETVIRVQAEDQKAKQPNHQRVLSSTNTQTKGAIP